MRARISGYTQTQSNIIISWHVFQHVPKKRRPRLKMFRTTMRTIIEKLFAKTHTLFRKPAYPPRIFFSMPGLTWVLMSPQNIPVAAFPILLLVSGLSSRSKCTVDSPPMSPSQPVANCLTSAGVLKEYNVLADKRGESAPFINITNIYE